jgi:arginase family enzyme
VTEHPRFLDFRRPTRMADMTRWRRCSGYRTALRINRRRAAGPCERSFGCAGCESAFVDELDNYDFDLGRFSTASRSGWSIAATSPSRSATVRDNAERARTTLRRIVARGTVPLVIGGDDSIPPMLAWTLAEQHRFHVVTVDAHLDFRDEVGGESEGR